MKKRIVFTFAAVMLILLCGCKSKATKTAEKLIGGIGTVTVDSERAISDAREYYDALSIEDRVEVKNLPVLEEAEKALEEAKQAEAEEQTALKKIEKVERYISDIGDVSMKSNYQIHTARLAYDDLDADLQQRVGNYDTLEQAEEQYFNMQVAEVEMAISAIGTVNAESGKLISDARAKYTNASEQVRGCVSNYDLLESAEKLYHEVSVKNVIDAINAVGEIKSADDTEKYKAAKKLYDSLSSDDKESVTNYAKLEAAKDKLEELDLQRKIENIQSVIQITSVDVSQTGHGSFKLYMNFVNKSEKTIKYLEFYVSFYNAVGDIVEPIGQGKQTGCQATGPFEQGEGISGNAHYWGPFYESTAVRAEIKNAKIIYMDGSTLSIPSDLIQYAQN